jgi:type VI protein secretion system component Hcp
MAKRLYLRTDSSFPGESVDSSHYHWIELVSFSWGETRSGARPGTDIPSSSAPRFGSLKLLKFVDSSSPQLMTSCAKEKTFNEWRIHVQETTPSPHCIYGVRLLNATVSALDARCEDPYLSEEISVIFDKIELEYVTMVGGNEQGRMVRGYDLVADKTYTPDPFLYFHPHG